MTVQVTSLYQNRLRDMVSPSNLAGKLRRADDFIRMAVIAAHEIDQAKFVKEGETTERCGLVLGSTFGTMETNFEGLGAVVFAQQSSPILFSHSVFNAAAGYLASIFNIQGSALTINDFTFPFFRALREGILALESGRLDRCLVLQVESYSTLLRDARRRHLPGVEDWQPGVVCWLLEKVEGAQQGCSRPEINDRSYQPMDLLQFQEQLTVVCGGEKNSLELADPLGAAMAVSEVLKQNKSHEKLAFQLLGAWGKVVLELIDGKSKK